jgi:hypothetical protein
MTRELKRAIISKYLINAQNKIVSVIYQSQPVTYNKIYESLEYFITDSTLCTMNFLDVNDELPSLMVDIDYIINVEISEEVLILEGNEYRIIIVIED